MKRQVLRIQNKTNANKQEYARSAIPVPLMREPVDDWLTLNWSFVHGYRLNLNPFPSDTWL
ncbi:MAG: hypothetical protein IPH20_04205 [Bacteroidales bacterium]|nr:hypothetical protein [Bacteroidales bacterium]